MISLKDYAKEKGVSYEAIRQQVKRYKKELEGHIYKESRTQYLDDEAVAILDSKRAKNPVVLMESSKDEEIEQLRNENKALLVKVTELQNALLEEKDRVHALQQEKIEYLEQRDDAAADADRDEPTPEEGAKKWWQFWK